MKSTAKETEITQHSEVEAVHVTRLRKFNIVSFCVTCGAEMQATFCGKCGTKTNQSSTNSSISTGASPQK